MNEINNSNDFVVFRNSVPYFFAEITNYRLYLEKLLLEQIISKTTALHPAVRLLQIQLVNLTKQLTTIERLLD